MLIFPFHSLVSAVTCWFSSISLHTVFGCYPFTHAHTLETSCSWAVLWELVCFPCTSACACLGGRRPTALSCSQPFIPGCLLLLLHRRAVQAVEVLDLCHVCAVQGAAWSPCCLLIEALACMGEGVMKERMLLRKGLRGPQHLGLLENCWWG